MASAKIKIAIVDDERDLCFLLESYFNANGYEAVSFHTLESAMEGMQAMRPDWVILDNDLPDGLGWARTGEILEMFPGVNIIKISANPDSIREQYRSNVYYLIKPIDVTSIVALINNHRQAAS